VTVHVFAAFEHDTFRLESASSWAFPESDRRAGEYLNGLIAAKPDTKILVDSSTFAFLNLQVASQHPEAFLTNSVPEQQTPSILPSEGSVRTALAGQRIDLLVFHSALHRQLLDQSPDVAKLAQFGGWSVYRLAH